MLLLPDAPLTTLLHTLTPTDFTALQTALSTALTTFSQTPTQVQQPPRTSLTSGAETTLFMPSSLDRTTAIKTVTLGPTHAPRGTVTIFSQSGTPLGVLSAEELTGFRTALASVLLPLHQARELGTVLVFGAGKQAEWAVRLVRRAYPDAEITVVGRGETARIKRWEGVAGEERVRLWGRASESESELEARVGRADAVFCCTPSLAPLFPAAWLRGNVYLSLVGSYKPDMMEVDPALLGRADVARVVVDSVEACLLEAGELVQGNVGRDKLVELGSVLAKEPKGVYGPGIEVFKCVGLGVMDLVAGREMLRIAGERGIGINVGGFEEEEEE